MNPGLAVAQEIVANPAAAGVIVSTGASVTWIVCGSTLAARNTPAQMGATETDGQTEQVWSPGFSRQGVQLCKEIENFT